MTRLATVILAGLIVLGGTLSAQESPEQVGKASYDRACAPCHGLQGSGLVAPRLAPLEKDVTEVFAIIREGRGEMPPVSSGTLSDEAMASIVAYLASLSPAAGQPAEPAARPSGTLQK